MFSTGRRIKAPERGLLTMHPFVDVLEGRNLFTATVHDGLLAVEAVIDGPPAASAGSPWSAEAIGTAAAAAASEDPALVLAGRGAAAVVELEPATAEAPFGERTIGDTPWALFGNALHDRRGVFAPQPLPTPAQVAAAAARIDAVWDGDGPGFSDERPMTGAMMPFLTMAADHARHPFAA